MGILRPKTFPVSDRGEAEPLEKRLGERGLLHSPSLIELRGIRGECPLRSFRPGYPSAGCFPAEPASVSPGTASLTRIGPRTQIAPVARDR